MICVPRWVKYNNPSRTHMDAQLGDAFHRAPPVPLGGTVTPVIESWRDGDLREFFVNDRRYKRLPADLESRLFRKLQMLDDATADADLRSPPSNHFEKLSGALKGLHSLRVNGQWRLIFAWDGSSASDLYLDAHTYR